MTTYREGAQRVGATLDTLRPKVDQLERMSRETVAKIKEEDRRTQAEIKRLESKFVLETAGENVSRARPQSERVGW